MATRPIHPGEILRDALDERGLSANALAGAIKAPANRVTAILKGARSISADSALRLARFFGTTPEVWLNLQLMYELEVAERAAGKSIKRNIKPVAA